MKISATLTLCADLVINFLKENYGLKGTKMTYGDLDDGGNIQVLIKSPKGNIEVGTVRLEYFAQGGIFPAFWGGIESNQSFRNSVDELKQLAERRSK
jgi:hypothetical protein